MVGKLVWIVCLTTAFTSQAFAGECRRVSFLVENFSNAHLKFQVVEKFPQGGGKIKTVPVSVVVEIPPQTIERVPPFEVCTDGFQYTVNALEKELGTNGLCASIGGITTGFNDVTFDTAFLEDYLQACQKQEQQ